MYNKHWQAAVSGIVRSKTCTMDRGLGPGVCDDTTGGKWDTVIIG